MLDLQRSINRVSRSRHWKRTGGHVAVIGLLALAAATGIVSGTGRGAQQGAAANGSQPSLSFGLVALARAAESSTNPLAPLVVHLDPAAYQPTLSRDGSGGRVDPTLGNVSPLTLDQPLPAPPAPEPAPEPAREQGPVTDEPAPQSVAVAAGSDAASPGEPAAPDGAPQRPLSWPVPGGAISQYFYAGHQGLDIAAPWNAPVLASADGVVTYAGWKNNGGGLVVEIAHETGLITSYNHLGGIWVNPGQEIARGEGIGAIGCTGLCYGSHLHFAVFVGLYADNPLRYF